MKNYRPFPATEQALGLVRRGHTVTDAARTAGIARSTLMRAMRANGEPPRQSLCGMHVRHARKTGLLPPAATRPAVTTEHLSTRMAHGLALARSGSMSVSEAARKAGCSRSALSRRLHSTARG